MAETDPQIRKSTPDQAKKAFEAIGSLTTFGGERLGDRIVSPTMPITIPEEIARQFPVTSPDAQVEQSLVVSRSVESESGIPLSVGFLATIAFHQITKLPGRLPATDSLSFDIVRVKQKEFTH